MLAVSRHEPQIYFRSASLTQESREHSLTWRNSQQFLLDSVDEVFDLLCGPAPENQTMSRIYVAGLDGWIAQSEQDRINTDAWKVLI